MADLIVSNNATSTLAAALDVASTQVSINPSDAKLFPYVVDGRWCPLTIVDGTGGYEIVHATRRAGGIFTVIRGQENTQARNFPVGSRIDLRLTAAIIDEIATKKIIDSRLPERLQPKNMKIPDNNVNNISENGTYDTDGNTQNCARNEPGMLRHSGSDTTNVIQEWTALTGTRQYIRMKRDGNWTPWSETTIQPDRLSPWTMKIIGEPFPLMDFLGNTGQPPRDKEFRYIKLSAYDSYNDGVLVSETVSGADPNMWATAVIQLSGSPLNGQTVRLINTERRFLRAGNAGGLEDSQNLFHGHGGWIENSGNHQHSYLGGYLTMNNSSESGKQMPSRQDTTRMTDWAGTHTHTLHIEGNGGNESRPRNMGINYYMRIK